MMVCDQRNLGNHLVGHPLISSVQIARQFNIKLKFIFIDLNGTIQKLIVLHISVGCTNDMSRCHFSQRYTAIFPSAICSHPSCHVSTSKHNKLNNTWLTKRTSWGEELIVGAQKWNLCVCIDHHAYKRHSRPWHFPQHSTAIHLVALHSHFLTALHSHPSRSTPQPSISQHSTAIFSQHSTAIFLAALHSHPSHSTPQPSFSQHSTAILLAALHSHPSRSTAQPSFSHLSPSQYVLICSKILCDNEN